MEEGDSERKGRGSQLSRGGELIWASSRWWLLLLAGWTREELSGDKHYGGRADSAGSLSFEEQ